MLAEGLSATLLAERLTTLLAERLATLLAEGLNTLLAEGLADWLAAPRQPSLSLVNRPPALPHTRFARAEQGTIDRDTKCHTCGGTAADCPGHFAYVAALCQPKESVRGGEGKPFMWLSWGSWPRCLDYDWHCCPYFVCPTSTTYLYSNFPKMGLDPPYSPNLAPNVTVTSSWHDPCSMSASSTRRCRLCGVYVSAAASY